MPIKFDRNTILIMGGIGALLGGIVTVASYINMRDHRKFLKANAKLENELTRLDIELRKNQLNGNSYQRA